MLAIGRSGHEAQRDTRLLPTVGPVGANLDPRRRSTRARPSVRSNLQRDKTGRASNTEHRPHRAASHQTSGSTTFIRLDGRRPGPSTNGSGCALAFIALCRRWAREHTYDSAAQAVTAFYDQGGVDLVPKPDKWTSKETVTIVVDGRPVTDSEALWQLWQRVVEERKSGSTDGDVRHGLCLACGRVGALLNRMPQALPKALVPGAEQEVALVSANKPIHDYDFSEGLGTAPICVDCGRAAVANLQSILADRDAARSPTTGSAPGWHGGSPAGAAPPSRCSTRTPPSSATTSTASTRPHHREASPSTALFGHGVRATSRVSSCTTGSSSLSPRPSSRPAMVRRPRGQPPVGAAPCPVPGVAAADLRRAVATRPRPAIEAGTSPSTTRPPIGRTTSRNCCCTARCPARTCPARPRAYRAARAHRRPHRRTSRRAAARRPHPTSNPDRGGTHARPRPNPTRPRVRVRPALRRPRVHPTPAYPREEQPNTTFFDRYFAGAIANPRIAMIQGNQLWPAWIKKIRSSAEREHATPGPQQTTRGRRSPQRRHDRTARPARRGRAARPQITTEAQSWFIARLPPPTRR